MSGFIQPTYFTNGTNNPYGFIQSVKIDNLNADANSVLYSTDGLNIKGDNAILKFEENIKKLSVSNNFSYVSDYPIGVQTGWDEATFHTGLFSQNKNAEDGASTHILITNDLGSDSSHYGGLDMASSNSTVAYGQFGSMPNALGLSSQTSSIVITSNAGGQEPISQNENIMLCYANGTKALILNNEGRLIVGANNPSFSGSTYGGDDGGVDKVLTSDGAQGLKWTPAGGAYSFYNVMNETDQQTVKNGTPASPIVLYSKVDQGNLIQGLNCIVEFIANFSTTQNGIITFKFVDSRTPLLPLATVRQMCRVNGTDKHFHIPINFNFVLPVDSYTLTFEITASIEAGDIDTDTNDFYSITFNEIKGA